MHEMQRQLMTMQSERMNDHVQRSEPPLNFQLNEQSSPNQLIDESPHFQLIVSASAVNGGMRDIPEFRGKDWLKFKRRIQTAFKVAKIHTYLHHHPREGSRIELYNDEIAKGLIEQKLDNAQYDLVKDSKHAKDAWEILTKANDKRAQLKENDLWIKYLDHRLKPDQSIKTYLDEITGLWHRLKTHKNTITEHGLCVKVLHGLGEAYESTKDAAIASEVENIETLRNLLLSAERGKKNKEEHLKALRAEAQKSKKGNQDKKFKCWKCKTNRHAAHQCWKLHPELKPQQDKATNSNREPRTQANTAETEKNPFEQPEVYGWAAEARVAARQSVVKFDNHDPDFYPKNGDMMIDCGANLSMTSERNILMNYKNLPNRIKVGTSNGQVMHAIGYGQLHLFGGRVILPNVLYVPHVERTLLATKSFSKQGYEIRIHRRMRILDQDKSLIYQPREHNDLYFIPKDFIATVNANQAVTLQQAHQRFGHASDERLRHLVKHTTGLQLTGNTRAFCDACALSKSRARPFPSRRTNQPTRPNEIISSDLKGPLITKGKGGYRYYITFNDLYSTWCYVDFLQSKTAAEVLQATKRFLALAANETKHKTTIFLTDNGSEYVNMDMNHYLLQHNIRHYRTAPYSPQQNGTAERRNQTLMGMARCILIESCLDHTYWPFAVKYAAYTLNRLPTRSQAWRTPFESWH
jgi:transposase InsO family protein